MKQGAFSSLLFLAAVIADGTKFACGQSPGPSAETLLSQTAATYAAAKSYSDKSTALYRNRDGSERLNVTFQIWFSRPSDFRVDAESKKPGASTGRREVLWADGAVTRTWATDKAVSSHAKVQLARSGMFGTYAYHVPTLLEASYGVGRRLNDLSSPILVGEETFEDIECFHLRGEWAGDVYEVWIAKSDHLVHKILATYTDHMLEEIHRDIVVDQVIPKETFRFAPENETPAKKH